QDRQGRIVIDFVELALALRVLAENWNRLLAIAPRIFPAFDYAAQKTLHQIRLARQQSAGDREADVSKTNFLFGVAEHIAFGLLELSEITGAQGDGVDDPGLQRGEPRRPETHRDIGDRIGVDPMLAE